MNAYRFTLYIRRGDTQFFYTDQGEFSSLAYNAKTYNAKGIKAARYQLRNHRQLKGEFAGCVIEIEERLPIPALSEKSSGGVEAMSSTDELEKSSGGVQWKNYDTLTCSLGLEDSRWQHSKLGEFKQLSLLSATQTQCECCDRSSPEFPSVQTCEITSQSIENSTSSPAVSLAPEPVTAGGATASIIPNPVYGWKPCGASASASPGLSLWKTLKGLSYEDFEQCLADCEWQAINLTIRNSYRVWQWDLRNAAPDCLLLPTITACDGTKNSRPAGLIKSERWLRKNGVIPNSHYLSAPAMAAFSGFPLRWTACLSESPKEYRAESAPDTSTDEPLSPPKLPLPSGESVICPSCASPLCRLEDGCGICGYSPRTIPCLVKQPKQPEIEAYIVADMGDRFLVGHFDWSQNRYFPKLYVYPDSPRTQSDSPRTNERIQELHSRIAYLKSLGLQKGHLEKYAVEKHSKKGTKRYFYHHLVWWDEAKKREVKRHISNKQLGEVQAAIARRLEVEKLERQLKGLGCDV